MDKAAMLDTMATLQDSFNRVVHPDWRTHGYEYYRAVWVECAELLDHFGWKWWKHQSPDLDQVRLELVDIWHFGLSHLLRASVPATEMLAAFDAPGAAADRAHDPDECLRLAVEKLAQQTLAARAFALPAFAEAMRALPMAFDELFRLYVGKNVLNDFRQANGYKAGTYVKVWGGREDNEHLIEMLAHIEQPETAAQDLYGLLERRYRELTPSATR
jgi:hypothetical protein